MGGLTHLDDDGRLHMVDVGEKPSTRRQATAEGEVSMQAETLRAISSGEIEKGNVFAVARLAAIQAGKRTADWIPLCHPVPLDRLDVEMEVLPDAPGVRVRVTASADWKTGVEMEALTAVSAGLLALYDMCKSRDRGMRIGPIRLLEKSGGRSGTWKADP